MKGERRQKPRWGSEESRGLEEKAHDRNGLREAKNKCGLREVNMGGGESICQGNEKKNEER